MTKKNEKFRAEVEKIIVKDGKEIVIKKVFDNQEDYLQFMEKGGLDNVLPDTEEKTVNLEAIKETVFEKVGKAMEFIDEAYKQAAPIVSSKVEEYSPKVRENVKEIMNTLETKTKEVIKKGEKIIEDVKGTNNTNKIDTKRTGIDRPFPSGPNKERRIRETEEDRIIRELSIKELKLKKELKEVQEILDKIRK